MVRISKAEKQGFVYGSIFGGVIALLLYQAIHTSNPEVTQANSLWIAVLITIVSIVLTPFLAFGKFEVDNIWKESISGTFWGFAAIEWALIYLFGFVPIQH